MEDVGFVFRHHLVVVFDNHKLYRADCQNNRLNEHDERYQRLMCDRIAVAAETYKPIAADGGSLYVIVESRFTGNPFNHAFFPCGAGVGALGGACQALPDAKAAQWKKLAELQQLPAALAGGAIPAKL